MSCHSEIMEAVTSEIEAFRDELLAGAGDVREGQQPHKRTVINLISVILSLAVVRVQERLEGMCECVGESDADA